LEIRLKSAIVIAFCLPTISSEFCSPSSFPEVRPTDSSSRVVAINAKQTEEIYTQKRDLLTTESNVQRWMSENIELYG
jgi:hypothetical protein